MAVGTLTAIGLAVGAVGTAAAVSGAIGQRKAQKSQAQYQAATAEESAKREKAISKFYKESAEHGRQEADIYIRSSHQAAQRSVTYQNVFRSVLDEQTFLDKDAIRFEANIGQVRSLNEQERLIGEQIRVQGDQTAAAGAAGVDFTTGSTADIIQESGQKYARAIDQEMEMAHLSQLSAAKTLHGIDRKRAHRLVQQNLQEQDAAAQRKTDIAILEHTKQAPESDHVPSDLSGLARRAGKHATAASSLQGLSSVLNAVGSGVKTFAPVIQSANWSRQYGALGATGL